jgi:hypothetical protein
MTPDDARAVVLWRYPQVACGGDSAWEDTPPNAGWLDYTVEYRALPVAAYDALVAEVAALKQERDAMREALEKIVADERSRGWSGCIDCGSCNKCNAVKVCQSLERMGGTGAQRTAQAALDAAKGGGS